MIRAARLLRSRASEFGIRPDRIGIIGASAGSHIAGMAATLFDASEGRTEAPLDPASARPDFVALLYPVITMQPPFVHGGSRRNLLGAAPSPADIERTSLEKQARQDMPPVFLVHTAEDATVPLENSVMFYQAVRSVSYLPSSTCMNAVRAVLAFAMISGRHPVGSIGMSSGCRRTAGSNGRQRMGDEIDHRGAALICCSFNSMSCRKKGAAVSRALCRSPATSMNVPSASVNP